MTAQHAVDEVNIRPRIDRVIEAIRVMDLEGVKAPAGVRGPSCFKVRSSSKTARSRRHGSSFPDPGQVIFPGCAAKADSKETSEKGLRER